MFSIHLPGSTPFPSFFFPIYYKFCSRMNPQQVAQSRSSANGFTRRRGEKEMGTRVENKFHPGKSNFSKMTTAGLQTENKGEIESPSRHRLVYITTGLIGHQVDVKVIDGSVFTGIFHATNAEIDFGIILKMARVTKAGSSRGQKNNLDAVQKLPSKMLIIPAKELVEIVAKSVSLTRDVLTNELQHDQLHDIMIDSNISQSRHVDLERELEPWVPDDDDTECPELDNTFDRHWHRNALPMDDGLRYMGFQMPYQFHFCIRSQQDSLLHLFCQGETASQVWSYLKGVQHASFVQDSLSAFTKTCLQVVTNNREASLSADSSSDHAAPDLVIERRKSELKVSV
ncbi:hypothetical protein L1987_70518 [Smallanthus sonchifolius]|uniref:Uncharacterized protein n=1 Tax=Smallanthus sonchifolius TaxID=185202 RepID=A0ACB9AQQ1_9ASTR|nr:hypothetical protein L1987_70518 [Smallanthus sonchifolius]